MFHNGKVHPPQRPKLLYLAICGALAMPAIAAAQDAGVSQLAPVKVQGAAPAFKPETVQSVKFQAPLVDTPQTINIVPSEVLKQQNAQSLQDVLSNVPGITFSSGEGGAGWGDMFTIRGFSAEQSITVDGVRDSALSSRTDIFNLEQAEVYKGTGSIESGVAALGGSVNLVTKTPKLEDFYDLNVGFGSDNYRRTTADLNHRLGETTAFRLNAMYHHNDVAGRGPTDYDRWGVAPSFSWGLGTPTRITAAFSHQKDDNMPDFGLPLDRNGDRMRGIDREFWGGMRNLNAEETETNSAMLRLEHDFNDKVSVRNQTRWSETKRYTHLTTGGRLLNARTSGPGRVAATAAGQVLRTADTNDFWGYDLRGNETYPTGHLATARLQANINNYKGEIWANQTDINWDFNTGSVRHQMVTGLELYEETYRKQPYSAIAPDGYSVIDVREPSHYYSGPTKTVSSTNRSGAKVSNAALYVYDQITLNKNWEIAAGLRYDRYKVKWYGEDGSAAPKRQNEGLWSGRLGIVYKPVDFGSIYLSYSEASQASAAAAASRSGGGGDGADYSPGKANTWELGTKWDLLDDKLSLTGAIFQVERSNPNDTDEFGVISQRSAKERVRGFELGLAGNITPQWSAYGGFTVMNSKIMEDEGDPEQVGGKMKNVPDMTFNVWTNYAFDHQWDAGVGAQYVGKRRFWAGNATDGKRQGGRHANDAYMPSYWLFNASVGYKVNKTLALRMNVNNILDTYYIARGTSSSDGFQLYGVPGAGRSVILSAEARF
jgi:catecholate siderophore receptor